MQEKGTISVHTENIFPIIKKFLYSDQEVFLRELAANAVDATQKLKQLASAGQYEGDTSSLKVIVLLDASRKTITVRDQGVGMTADEIKKYINQVAFSGATEFLAQHKDQEKQQQLIGFFGLGFYAAFMVADKVEIVTRSYQQGAEAMRWTCDGTTTFSLSKTVKKEVGTDVVLHVSEGAAEFLQKEKIQQLLDKYGKFLPVPIEFEEKVINDTHPVWTQAPSALEDKAYLDFYKALYPSSPDPLFWIHLNVDYPFHLTGVLYFPRIAPHEFTQHTHKIQLYAKQMFITHEVKDIVPEFLRLLHGVIDSPDIPLNVSRSALQADSNVKKINTYIAKKVADKLDELFKQDRAAYEAKWPSIELFVKYGMLTDDKFDEKARGFTLVRSTTDQYFTLEAYQAKVKPQQTDRHGNLVLLYATAPHKQDSYIQSCHKQAYDVLNLSHPIDTHFVNFLEQKLDKVLLKGVDAAPVGQLIEKDATQESVLTEEETAKLKALYAKAVPNPKVTWEATPMSSEEPPVVVTIPEFVKRMHHTMGGTTNPREQMPLQASVNVNHPLAYKLLKGKKEEKQLRLARQAYQMALLAQDMLHGPERTSFIQHGVELLVSS